jgi:hypothetical protein
MTSYSFPWDGSETKDRFEIETVHSRDQPYRVRVRLGGLYSQRQDKEQQIKDWCNEKFGTSEIRWRNPRWRYASGGLYYFKYEKDMALFLLRWSA